MKNTVDTLSTIFCITMRIARNDELMEVCKEESNKRQIQKSWLDPALAFLRLEQVKIEQLYEGNGERLGFALLNWGYRNLYTDDVLCSGETDKCGITEKSEVQIQV